MDYFANSKLFGAAGSDEADVESGRSDGGGATTDRSNTKGVREPMSPASETADGWSASAVVQGWMSMLSGDGTAQSGGGEDGGHSNAEEASGLLGSTTSMLRGSMKSMGIGKKEEESALSVGRVSPLPELLWATDTNAFVLSE